MDIKLRKEIAQAKSGARSNVKHLVVLSMFLLIFLGADAQYYYGPPPPPPPHRQRENNPPPENQDEGSPKPSGFASINFGFATPEGSFAQDIGMNYGNYAQSGYQFNFSLGFPINHSNFGIAFMFASYNNGYDNNTWVNSNNGSFASIDGIPTGGSNIQYLGGTDNMYANSAIMGGLFYTLPIGRLSIDGRAMVGVLLCGLPERSFWFADTAQNTYEDDVVPSNPVSLAFDVGVGLRVLIANFGRRKICAMVNADYLFSNVSYNTQENLIETPIANNPFGQQVQIGSQQLTGTIPISLFSITFGIGYQF